jgi:hypothetical protein
MNALDAVQAETLRLQRHPPPDVTGVATRSRSGCVLNGKWRQNRTKQADTNGNGSRKRKRGRLENAQGLKRCQHGAGAGHVPLRPESSSRAVRGGACVRESAKQRTEEEHRSREGNYRYERYPFGNGFSVISALEGRAGRPKAVYPYPEYSYRARSVPSHGRPHIKKYHIPTAENRLWEMILFLPAVR